MKKVERVELVLENCEVFEIRAEEIGFLKVVMKNPEFVVFEGLENDVPDTAISLFFEVARIHGTFVLEPGFVEGEEYIVPTDRLATMDVVYVVFHYVDGTSKRLNVLYDANEVEFGSWNGPNTLEHVRVTDDAIYVFIGKGSTIEEEMFALDIGTDHDRTLHRFDRAKKAVEERKNSEIVKEILVSLEESRGMTINPVSDEERNEVERKGVGTMGEFMRTNAEIHEKYMESESSVLSELLFERLDAIPVIPSIQLDEIKVGGRVAYVNRQGDVVVEYVTDISGEFVGLGSGNIVHISKVTALVVG